MCAVSLAAVELGFKNMSSRKELLDIAADWYATLDAGMADLTDFESWRDADPRHAAAFACIIGTVRVVDRLKSNGEPE